MPDNGAREQQVAITVGAVRLEGDLVLPPGTNAVVVFAHGSGSSRHSRRNRFVAGQLQRVGLGTLLMDLLTLEEEREDMVTAQLRFNIDLLGRRVVGALDWLAAQEETRRLAVGCFGASTGAAAALVAAADRPDQVKAVVSRGGRPDLADPVLDRVQAPTLLIVGGNDMPVIGMNQEAMGKLKCHKQLQIVPGATHLFEEPGALEEVARLAADWFRTHLAGRGK